MKPIVIAVLWGLLASPVTRAQEEIIATRFEASVESLTAPPVSREALPLRTPTEIRIQPGGSSVTRGEEELNGWPPPYLLIRTGGLATQPEYPAWVSLVWDVGKLGLSSGIFELRWKVMPLGGRFHGAGATVILGTPDGKFSTEKIAQDRRPLRVGFTDKGNIRAAGSGDGSEPVPYETDSTYEFVMTFDLDAGSWSAAVDGVPLVEGEPFPETMAKDLVIQKVTITGTGVPETGVAVADVRLIQKSNLQP